MILNIDRVVHHARRLEQSATVVNSLQRAKPPHQRHQYAHLTVLTAVFLPLNLITGFFGMNFEFMPLIHHQARFGGLLA